MNTSKIVHFDTISSTTEEQLDEVYASKNESLTHCYFSKIPLLSPLYGVSNIELSSIEFPYTTYNIRAENESNLLTFIFLYKSTTPYTISIILSPKNYSSMSELIIDINSSLLVQIAQKTSLVGFSITLSINPKNTARVIFKSNCDEFIVGSGVGALFIRESIMAKYILGVSFGRNDNLTLDGVSIGNVGNVLPIYNATSGSVSYANNNYNLAYDNYFNITFSNLNHSGASNADSKVAVSFKLPLSCQYNETIYYTTGNSFTQCLSLESSSNRTVSNLLMKITDRFGFPVYGNGHHISFSLTFYF